jgi:glycosyltransferase involved in cell wall biosynthesis
MLEREWALYESLLAHVRSLIIVSYGNQGEAAALARVAGDRASQVRVVANEQSLSNAEYVASLPERVAPLLAGYANVVCKSNQLHGGDVALQLASGLRSMLPACTLATIARGGYLWSRFVAHEHGPDSEQAKQAEQRERTLCQQASLVVGTTQDMVRDLTWRYTLDPAKTLVIPNYVLPSSPSAGEREPGVVLYAGQLVARKRIDLLIRACEVAMQSAPNLTLKIVGEGPAKQDLQELAKACNVPATFLPRMPHTQLLAEMDRCSIYAQASELEGHPKTVLEAMSRGAPVIVTDAPGLTDVVQHGVTGLRCPANPEAMGQALAGLLMDSDWANVLGQSAKDCTHAALGLQAILPRELSAYRVALARASGTAFRESARAAS